MYRFTSSATGDLNMFDADAERVLAVIGKRTTTRGVITAEEIPAALAALRAAVHVERIAPPEVDDSSDEEQDEDDKPEPVTLGQRAHPFMAMLERAAAEQADVLWGL